MSLRAWLSRWFEGRTPEGAERDSSVMPEDEDSEYESEASLEDEEDEIDAVNPFPEPVALEIGDVFDLHTIAPRDVRRAVEAYLLEARLAGFRSVRIIHGKGVGVQREMVRAILARTPFVEAWTDAPPQSGGWGATVAHLLPNQEDEPQS